MNESTVAILATRNGYFMSKPVQFRLLT